MGLKRAAVWRAALGLEDECRDRPWVAEVFDGRDYSPKVPVPLQAGLSAFEAEEFPTQAEAIAWASRRVRRS